jgi:predicted MFS family arabinose efflux permease
LVVIRGSNANIDLLYYSGEGFAVETPRASPYGLVALLSAALFLARTVFMMMGPLLVALAAAFDTSVAAAGQLAAAIGISWGITAPLVGPISDVYGRRRVGLAGLVLMTAGILGSALAWSYWALLTCRLITGVGAAMIPPNSMAAIADHFPPAQRGTPISILLCVSFFGVAIGTPAVAVLVEMGGWRLPFYVVGALLVAVWGLQWYWFPQRTLEARTMSFFAHFREAGRSIRLWYVLVANIFYQTAALGIFVYLVAFLIHTYGMKQGETALPLAAVGTGAMLGSLLGGYVAGRHYRLAWAALALLLGGVCVSVALTVSVSPWTAIILCCASALLLTIFEPVTWALAAEFAEEARATANGLLATSNQLGIIGGASVGGLVLALGGFPLVGFFCLGAAASASAIVTALGLRIARTARLETKAA